MRRTVLVRAGGALATFLAGLATALTAADGAVADSQSVCVQLPSGQVLMVTVPVVPGVAPVAPGQIVDPARCAPTAPVAPPAQPSPPAGTPTTTVPLATTPGSGARKPSSGTRRRAGRTPSRTKAKTKTRRAKGGQGGGGAAAPGTVTRGATRAPGGVPTALAPGFMDALPGPSVVSGVPNFVIDKFRVPVFLLPIYQAAGIQYGVRWEVLAAINEIETDYGRNLNVSTAGALGWMQFIPSTWRTYGVDANRDGKKDPYNPVDAIFAAARYLKAAGYEKDARRAVFAYNHATWYVDSVMLRARLIAGVPADLVGSLTGLTEGRFPVAARARYADDLQQAEATKRVKRGQNAANVIASKASRKQIQIFAKQGSPVVATQDGQIKKITKDSITLQDAYGNRYTYRGLGSVAREYPAPKQDAAPVQTVAAVTAKRLADPAPTRAASAGRQPAAAPTRRRPARQVASRASTATAAVKQRLFAHPDMPGALQAGGSQQALDAATQRGGASALQRYFAQPYQGKPSDVRIRPLRPGAQVIGGTILGRVRGPVAGTASHVDFSIRPAGKGAPQIDPKPILDGWKLLEATAIYRASGRNALAADAGGLSIGQTLLLSKPLLERRVLADPRVQIYAGGRDDIRSGQIDRRVLATLEFLAQSGMNPTVTSLKGNHGLMTASGNISEHSSGNAVDIGAINGTPIAGHQDPGGITEQAVRRLMTLQGTMTPHQIISLLDLGRNTLSMADHADHIHVGFHPLYGTNSQVGREAMAILKPGQWSNLIDRLAAIKQPQVPTKASKYALPAKTGSGARPGD